MNHRIAIDFGTTRTKVAYCLQNGSRPELMRFGGHQYLPYAPSLFYLPKDGSAILFGDEAEHMVETDPAGVVDAVKRRRHNQTVRAGNGRAVPFSELLVTLFEHIRSHAAREIAAFEGAAPNEVVLTLPVCFGPNEHDLWRETALKAGFHQAVVIVEPVAAALGWASAGGDAREGVIVLDCGGGTVDWALLRHAEGKLSVDASAPPGGLVDLGGHDIDTGLLELVEAQLAERGVESLEFGTARRPKLLRELRRVKEAVSQGQSPPDLIIESTKVSLTRQQVADEISSRFVVNASASFNRFLIRVREVNGNKNLPLLIVGGGAKVNALRASIDSDHVQFLNWDGSEFAPALGAAEFDRSLSANDMLEAGRKPNSQNQDEEAGERAFQYGMDFASGNGKLRDLTAAAAYYREAAELGHRSALLRLVTLDFMAQLLGIDLDISGLTEIQQFVTGLARQGNASAQFKLSEWRSYGSGSISKDKSIEIENLRLAVDQGNVDAAIRLSSSLIDSDNSDKNKSYEILNTLANSGNAGAQNILGGTFEHTSENVEFLKSASNHGNIHSQKFLGLLYRCGVKELLDKDIDMAHFWYKKAAIYGDSDVLFSIFCLDIQVLEYDKEAAKILKACSEGDRVALYIAGDQSISGYQRFEKDERTGLKNLERSAQSGYSWSQLRLAEIYFGGDAGVERSLDKAQSFARKASLSENPYCQGKCGLILLGTGRRADSDDGVKLLHQAAERGDEQAQYALAVLLAHGLYVEPDFDQAINWLKRASNGWNLYAGRHSRAALGMLQSV